jgi:hypothetical protein
MRRTKGSTRTKDFNFAFMSENKKNVKKGESLQFQLFIVVHAEVKNHSLVYATLQ